MSRGFDRIWHEVDDDDTVRVVIITGAGERPF
jgi:enoyl-CoA hydratase/carnithine racemase